MNEASVPVNETPDSVIMVLFLLMVGLMIWGIVALVQGVAMQIKYRGQFLCKGKVKHISGLNLPDGTICLLMCHKSKMVLTANGQEITLPSEKLVSVEILSKTEIKKQYAANPGGALAGALIGGVVGAVVLGSPSKKNIRIPRNNLAITYLSDGEPKYILFDATYRELYAQKVVNKYKYLRKKPLYKTEL